MPLLEFWNGLNGEGSSARNSSARKNCSTPKSWLLNTVRADDKNISICSKIKKVCRTCLVEHMHFIFPIWKKLKIFFFTVAKILSSARKFEQMHFFYQLLKIDMWNTYSILFSVEQMTFFCRAVEIPKKSVEQSRFKQLHFEQLTLTRLNPVFLCSI